MRNEDGILERQMKSVLYLKKMTGSRVKNESNQRAVRTSSKRTVRNTGQK